MSTDTKLLRIDEAADQLRCSKSTLYRHVSNGLLTAYRVGPGSPLLFRPADLDRLLKPTRLETR